MSHSPSPVPPDASRSSALAPESADTPPSPEAAGPRGAPADATSPDAPPGTRPDDWLWRDVAWYSSQGLVAADGETFRILACNPAYAAMHGVRDPAAVVGRHLVEFYLPEDQADWVEAVRRADETGACRWETRHVRADGGVVSVAVALSGLRRAATGGTTGSTYRVAVVEDLTARETVASALATAERELAEARAARAAADAAAHARDTVFAGISHELRTPINAAIGYLDLLDDEIPGPLTDAQRAMLARIRRSHRLLLDRLTDILTLARSRAGRLHLRPAHVAVQALLEDLEVLAAPLTSARRLAYQCPPVRPALAVRADPERVHQVLANLVANAAKFTPDGGTVTVDVDADAQVVRLHVRDTGAGIPPELRAPIFEPFVRGPAAERAGIEGSGLGLAISRELARAMGGDLTLTSVLGAGSTFTLTLPRADTRPEDATAGPP